MALGPELQSLSDQVTATVGVNASAVTLLNGIAARIDAIVAAGGSPPLFTALATQLKTSADALAAAVLANSPPTP